jgi:hypothetical protein
MNELTTKIRCRIAKNYLARKNLSNILFRVKVLGLLIFQRLFWN